MKSTWHCANWVGKTIIVVAGLWGLGWLVGGLGMDATARELGRAAIVLLSVLATFLVVRTIWRNHAGRPQR